MSWSDSSFSSFLAAGAAAAAAPPAAGAAATAPAAGAAQGWTERVSFLHLVQGHSHCVMM